MLALLAASLVGCSPSSRGANTTPSPSFSTATLSVVLQPTGTQAAIASDDTATPTSISGSLTVQVNVRQEPMASGRVLGTLAATAGVQVFSRDPAGNWFQIAYEAGDGGRGWVAAQYVVVTDPAAIPPATGNGGPLASVREQINVRSGPGIQFDALGLLSARDAVTLTGKDRSAAWVQIAFASGAEGRGWVAASFLDSTAMDGLPILTDEGQVLGTSTPPFSGPSPTPEPATAPEDDDTLSRPGMDVRFSPGGLGAAFYTSDLSAPAGDTSDWIRFTPYFDAIRVSLECSGGEIIAQVIEAGTPLAGAPAIECGMSQVITLKAGSAFVLHLSIAVDGSEGAYVHYTLSLFASASP